MLTTLSPSTAASATSGWLPRLAAAGRRPAVAPRRRILLAEDDLTLRRLLAATLRRHGYDVDEASDGLAAIAYLRPWLFSTAPPRPPDLIVSDVRMPGWSGLEILDALRCADVAVPIVLITGFGAPDLHAAARRLGAAAVLDKPFEIATLCRIIRDQLDAKQ